MVRAPNPINEVERQKELESFGILDSETESQFDSLTKLAASVTDCPTALISLVSNERQWFKSRYGLEACQTDRSEAFCGYTILQDVPLVIEDATQDDRVSDGNLVCGDPHIRFYAGVPLISSRGFALGSLCVIDYEPRKISEDQLAHLQTIADQVMYLLELRRLALELNSRLVDTETDYQGIFSDLRDREEFLGIISRQLQPQVFDLLSVLNLLESEVSHDSRLCELVEVGKLKARQVHGLSQSLTCFPQVKLSRPTGDLKVLQLSTVLDELASSVGILASLQDVRINFEARGDNQIQFLCDTSQNTSLALYFINKLIELEESHCQLDVSVDVELQGDIAAQLVTSISVGGEDCPKIWHNAARLEQLVAAVRERINERNVNEEFQVCLADTSSIQLKFPVSLANTGGATQIETSGDMSG